MLSVQLDGDEPLENRRISIEAFSFIVDVI
jgi:hypothetical protein